MPHILHYTYYTTHSMPCRLCHAFYSMPCILFHAYHAYYTTPRVLSIQLTCITTCLIVYDACVLMMHACIRHHACIICIHRLHVCACTCICICTCMSIMHASLHARIHSFALLFLLKTRGFVHLRHLVLGSNSTLGGSTLVP